MISHTNADGYVIQYRYDANGNITNLIYPGNRTVTYAYDTLNRLTNVADWAQRKTSIEYDLASRVKRITRPNGTVREINYDAAGQTTNIVERLTNNAPVAFFKLKWNNAARVDLGISAARTACIHPARADHDLRQ
jgi:YD repeat-containing protein